MSNNGWEISRIEQTAVLKTAFLSYYISMYNSVNKEIGYEDASITVDEIYDFIQDLKHEGMKQVPNISKEDISYCFHVLQMSGVCKP
jgi:predicted transcriptional regulator